MGSSSTSFCLGMSTLCCAFSASEISLVVTAPKRRPPAPAFAGIFTRRAFSRSAAAMAASFWRASSARRAFSFRFMVLMASAVAAMASFRGRR